MVATPLIPAEAVGSKLEAIQPTQQILCQLGLPSETLPQKGAGEGNERKVSKLQIL